MPKKNNSKKENIFECCKCSRRVKLNEAGKKKKAFDLADRGL